MEKREAVGEGGGSSFDILFGFEGERNKRSDCSGTEQVPHDGGEMPHGGGEQPSHSGMYAIK